MALYPGCTKWGPVTVSSGAGEKAEPLGIDGKSINPRKAFSKEVQMQPSHWQIGFRTVCVGGPVEIQHREWGYLAGCGA